MLMAVVDVMQLGAGSLPTQANGFDCSLFMLAYAEYFLYCTPTSVHVQADGVVTCYWKPGLFQPPAFLQPMWFGEYPVKLVGELRTELLEHAIRGMCKENGVSIPDELPGWLLGASPSQLKVRCVH